jgi:hypothetical protein
MQKLLLLTAVVSGLTSQLAGCGGRPPDARELSAKLTQANSAAVESQIALSQLAAGRLSASFARVHLLYLAREMEDAKSDITSRTAPPGLEALRESCVHLQELLAEALRFASSHIDDPVALRDADERIERIRTVCEQARRQL